MKMCKYIVIVSCLFVSSTLFAATQRFDQSFSIEVPINDKAVPLLKAYLSAVEALRPFMVESSKTEPIIQKTHICHNGDNPVVSCKEETVQDVKDLNVDAIEVAVSVATEATVDPKATPTPKP